VGGPELPGVGRRIEVDLASQSMLNRLALPFADVAHGKVSQRGIQL